MNASGEIYFGTFRYYTHNLKNKLPPYKSFHQNIFSFDFFKIIITLIRDDRVHFSLGFYCRKYRRILGFFYYYLRAVESSNGK